MGRPLKFTRAESLEKALKLFWSNGYSAVSTDDLCKTMGIKKPSLYNSFKSKEDLYIECLVLYNQNYSEKLISVMYGYSDPIEGVEKMLLAVAKQFKDPNFPGGCLAITGLVEVIGKSKKIDRHLRVIQRNFISAFENHFVKKFKYSKVSKKKLAQYVVGQLYALAIFSKTNKDLFDFKFFIFAVRGTIQKLTSDSESLTI